jgi:hypothetical protein
VSYAHTFSRSDARYFIVGSYLDSVTSNKEIEPGGCFAINLLAPPFSFPQPLESFAERGATYASVVATDPAAAASTVNTLDPLPRKYLLMYNLKKLCQSDEVVQFLSKF